MEKQTNPDFGQVKDFIENGIPFLKKVGILVEEVATGKIKLGVHRDVTNLNHFGTYQAGVYMTLAEAAGAALLATILDLSDVLLLTKECHVKFGDPAKDYLTYEGGLDHEVADKIINQLVRNRKMDVPMKVILRNENGKMAAEASLIYYLRAGSSAIINAQSNQKSV